MTRHRRTATGAASAHVAVADGRTVLCPDPSIGEWSRLLDASRDQHTDAAAGPPSGLAVTSPLVSNTGRAYRGRHRAVPSRSVGDRGRWVRLGVAAGLTALLVPVVGLLVPLISTDPAVMAQAGATPKPGSPGGNHSKPGDNKKKKKSDNNKKKSNNSNHEGSSARRSSSDSGTQRSGSSFSEQTNANNRWTADGPNRSVNTRVSSQAQPPRPPQTQTQVIQAPPSQGRQSTTAPTTGPQATAPTTQTPPASQTPPVQQQVPPATPPAQQAAQTVQQPPRAVAASAPAAPSNPNNTTTGLVIGLGAAAGAGLASRRNGASSQPSGAGVRVTPDNLAAALTNPANAPAGTGQNATLAPITRAAIGADPSLATTQLDRVNAARAALDAQQAPVNQAAVSTLMGDPNAPSRDASEQLAQNVFGSRQDLVNATLNLAEVNQSLLETGQQPVAAPALPQNANVLSYPAQSSEFARSSAALSQGSLGLIPDVARDFTTFTNWGQSGIGDRVTASLDAAGVIPGFGLVGKAGKFGDALRTIIKAEDDVPTGALLGPALAHGPSFTTTLTEQGGRITYQGIDELGRPTGITARITQDMLATGTNAGRAFPPGWQVDAGLARGHLLAKVLGGSGTEARNIVSIIQNPVNSPVMRGFELSVRDAVAAGNGTEIVDYAVTPLYRGASLMPEAVQIVANGQQGFQLAVTVLNR